ncbi:MAG: flagellar brake protein, partial [Rhodocyclaceae bacterium]|nr:flagellar brake protein [Rhodocyclaceae bacterium]
MNTPEQDTEDISRFLVDNAELIRGIFDGMLERRVFIALSIPHVEGSLFMSMLSSIEGRTITFDLPADPALTGQVLRHGKLNASAQDGGVQVQFRLSEIQR